MSFEPEIIIKEIDSQYGKLNVVEMEAYLIRTINDVAEKHGVNHRGFAALLNELGGFYRTTSRYQKSEEFFLKAKEILEGVIGENNPDYATTINNLAGVYRLNGDFIKAEELFLKAIDIYKRISYEKSFVYSSALNNLGLIYMDTKEFEKAARLFEEANAIAKEEKNSPVIYATGLGNLGNAYLALGQIDKAKKMLIEAVHVYKAFGKEDNNHYASSLNSLATFYFHTKKSQKAEPLFLKVLSLREKEFGRNHHEFAKTAFNLCKLYEESQRYDLACKYAKLSADSYLSIFGKEHSAYISSVEALRRNESLRLPKEHLIASGEDLTASGMDLALLSFLKFSASVLCKKYAAYMNRIAAGLVGEGSECYGFDDQLSKDHDWGPDFCLWLTKKDYDEIGEELQRDYEKHVSGLLVGDVQTKSLIRSRRGVFEIDSFYRSHIGFPTAPASLLEWLSISETKLSTVTNGKIFVDSLGTFSHRRATLNTYYPEDLRLKKMATHCALMAQSGQYNYPRSLNRREHVAAQHALSVFIDSSISFVFLLNKKYKPYYKWMHRAVKGLPLLGEKIYNLTKLLASENEKLLLIEEICQLVSAELRHQRLSDSKSDFLMEHVPSIHRQIQDEELRSLPIRLEE